MRRRQSEFLKQRDGYRVEVVPVAGAVRLCTHCANDARTVALAKGAIVRVVPGAHDTPEERAATKAFLLEQGAFHVWFAPRAAAPEAVNRKPKREARPAQSPRALVEKMVAEAHTRDRALLAQVVDEALTQAGM